MKELGLTQEELAKKLGVTRSAVAHYFQGTRHPPLKQFVKLATILKVDPAWLQFGNTSSKAENKLNSTKLSSKQIPVIDWQHVAKLNFEDSLSMKENALCYLQHFLSDEKAYYALQVKGDSMTSSSREISFNQGSYLIVDSSKTPRHGNFVIAISSNKNEAILRQYIEERGINYLKPLNPQYPLIQLDHQTNILGIVIANVYLTL